MGLYDILTPIIAQEAAALIVGLVYTLLTALAGLALDQARRWFGAETVAKASAAITPAIERAIARAEAAGLSGESLQREAQAYLERTMTDTLRRLRPKPGDLRQRIEAQLAARSRSASRS
ncbi:hypothetical protein [Wenxinia saemankumensis]|uniref:Bacteriophage holin of superfamily 6 (Holin_LLH) n=1 Tax=Wenxinia saemankumensis TaxID=1447782 RepID=A0A1M6F0W7_9RHOB|nr:hypothetical protein [Wenxinia saemankumensis]SHI91327.1 hypothetical protein SAMN05444417_2290 [Wenxinia saemankumensis]